MLKKIQIKKFLNKIKSKPYIIAEVGVNHECSIKKAKKMILMAILNLELTIIVF